MVRMATALFLASIATVQANPKTLIACDTAAQIKRVVEVAYVRNVELSVAMEDVNKEFPHEDPSDQSCGIMGVIVYDAVEDGTFSIEGTAYTIISMRVQTFVTPIAPGFNMYTPGPDDKRFYTVTQKRPRPSDPRAERGA